jgi:hypothetical protein
MSSLLEKETQHPVATSAEVHFSLATWGLPPATEQSNGAIPEDKRGRGARLAVRKFGGALNKLADN